MSFGRRRTGRRPGNEVSVRDLAQYRPEPGVENPFDGRSVDVDDAAQGLGVSKKAVRDAIAKATAALSDRVFRRISGRSEADTSQDATPRGLLQAAFGRGPRGGSVDAKAAAQALGVSPGTVRRWAAGTQKPAANRLTSIRTAARRATTTKRGRKAAVDEFRNSSAGKDALQYGTQVWVYGLQGVPAPEGKSYSRDHRTIYRNMGADDIERMLVLYEERGIEGFREWLRDLGTAYMDGDEWEFTDIYDLGFGRGR